MSDHRRVEFDLLEGEGDEIDMTLSDFITKLRTGGDRLAVPDARPVRVQIRYEPDPYDSGGWLICKLWRPETDRERVKRETQEQHERAVAATQREARREAAERADYERLRAKFEGGGQ